MAGNARFELTSGSQEPGFAGNQPNGQKGKFSVPSMDRSGSFREGGESRIFGFGTGMSRCSGTMTGNLPPLSQCLMLEPIMMGVQKYTRYGELRRVLGFSTGNASEDNSFGAAHCKPSPPVTMDELKRYKASIVDGLFKARARAKILEEHLQHLDKFVEGGSSKKQQSNELIKNEQSGGLSLKMATQIHQNPPDFVTQRLDDRTKNVVLNKRQRTSVAETRAECQSNGQPRQPLVMAKDQDMFKDSGAGSDLVGEKTHRLPAGGEGWDKKTKRKRSVGTASMRPIDSDRELKRAMHQNLSHQPGLQSCDAQGFRSGSLNGISGINKLDRSSPTAKSNVRATSNNEQHKAVLQRNLATRLKKDRILAKGNDKSNICDDNHVSGPSIVTKSRALRAPRTGSVVATNTSPNIPRVSGTYESWEQPRNVNKTQSITGAVNKIYSITGANNRKCVVASGSPSPPMAQRVVQRPQKVSRTRRANLVSPVSNHDGMQISSEECSSSDFSGRASVCGTNGLLLSKGMANRTQKCKLKLENVTSPARLSESEESGAGEDRFKGKGTGSDDVEEKTVNAMHNAGSSVMLTKKNKLLTKEETGDGVRRQGRSRRSTSFYRASVSPITEKLENADTRNPSRSSKSGSDKNGSKFVPSSKKLSDRKGFSNLGHIPTSNSPDFTAQSDDDDHEELLAAANFACNGIACSSLFWKKMEPIFASVSFEDISYLSEQGDLRHGETSPSLVAGEGNRSLLNQVNMKESARTVELVNQFQDIDTLCGRLDSERRFNEVTPLYQRVLSALIEEDDIEELEENGMRRNVLPQYATDDSPYDTCLLIDAERRKRDRMDSECELMLGVKTKKQVTVNEILPCNGSTTSNRSASIQNPSCNDDLLHVDGEFVRSEFGMLAGLSRNDMYAPQNVQTNDFGISSSNCQHEQMCLDDKLLLELQSIGLYPDKVPDLDDSEDELINQEIVALKKGLHQQIGKKKMCLDRICKAIHKGREMERWELEQVAMNRLVELAYKKQLATQGSSASRSGVAKVSKQAALAFVKRTLAKCRKFEDSGTSCFSEPALRDVIFAAPHRGNEAETLTCPASEGANDKHPESRNLQADRIASGPFPGSAERCDIDNKSNGGSLDGFETPTNQSDLYFAKNGPISNRGKKEVSLDVVGGSAALRATSTLGSSLLGGTKGKRSERERGKDTSTRNAVAKAGRPLLGHVKGQRKTKTKTKQKTAQLSISGSEHVSKFSETTQPVYPSAAGVSSDEPVMNCSNKKREVGLMSPGKNPNDSVKKAKEQMDFTNLHLHELDSLEELGVGADLGGPQDLISWLNFDDDGLQDHESAGLEIPLDDISELNMF
ncbi:uncharacterized protein LOC132311813 isoform X2 [Cornus florida]|uniref:uncharacterized protein LOC132311813 isoform X2 n=1 Tax=Cornus florida TaxID=4283 RepID=UPI0028A28F16|nr:uncharacterized protein LOC132311813 isoform X2 [Cornus florida]